MKIEIVEFYPLHKLVRKKKSDYLGTLHIFIEDFEIDIRGIMVIIMSNGNWFFQLPSVKTLDEDGKKVSFPVFSFLDYSKQRSILDFCHKKCIRYIQENFSDYLKKVGRQAALKRKKTNVWSLVWLLIGVLLQRLVLL